MKGTQVPVAEYKPANGRMKVIIHSITATNFGNLEPAPSVRDWEEMREALVSDTTPRFTTPAEFLGLPLEILTTYRGNLIYLAGGVSFTRINPTTCGGNGYTSLPTSNVIEKGSMQWGGVSYDIDAEFVV